MFCVRCGGGGLGTKLTRLSPPPERVWPLLPGGLLTEFHVNGERLRETAAHWLTATGMLPVRHHPLRPLFLTPFLCSVRISRASDACA